MKTIKYEVNKMSNHGNTNEYTCDLAPGSAYYNEGDSDPSKAYKKLIDSGYEGVVVSWSTKFLQLWDMILNGGYVGHIVPPPPLYIDRTDKPPRCTNKTTGRYVNIMAHMAESWGSTKDALSLPVVGRVFYQLRVYEKVVIDEIHIMCGKHPTTYALEAILDRLLIHELCHFIRNTRVWATAYDDKYPGTYEECVENTKCAVNAMGSLEDEMATEKLALRIFRDYYFCCMHHALIPTLHSPWNQFRAEKRGTEYEDAYLVYQYYALNWDLNYSGCDKKAGELIEIQQKAIINELTRRGKKRGTKFKLIE